MSIQPRIRRAQHDETRLGRVFPIEKAHKAQATLQRLVPHHGGRQMDMRFLWPRAEVLETVQGLAVDLPSICAPCPTALGVRTGVEKHAVGVAPQCGAGVQMEANDFINVLLLLIDLIILVYYIQKIIVVFYKLNATMERGTKPDALGRKPCHWTSTLKAAMVNASRA